MGMLSIIETKLCIIWMIITGVCNCLAFVRIITVADRADTTYKRNKARALPEAQQNYPLHNDITTPTA